MSRNRPVESEIDLFEAYRITELQDRRELLSGDYDGGGSILDNFCDDWDNFGEVKLNCCTIITDAPGGS